MKKRKNFRLEQELLTKVEKHAANMQMSLTKLIESSLSAADEFLNSIGQNKKS